MAFNDSGEMAFRGGMSGPGINPTNDTGRWLWSKDEEEEGEWQIIHREGDPAPEFGEGVTLWVASGVGSVLNTDGDKVNRLRLLGPGITAENDWVLVAGQPDPMGAVIREGDAVPEAGGDVYVEVIGGSFINDLHQILYYIKFAGPPIDESNQYGIYYG